MDDDKLDVTRRDFFKTVGVGSIATAVVFAVACGEEFVEPAVSVEAAGGRWSTGGRAPVTGGAPTTDPETGGASGSGIAAGPI